MNPPARQHAELAPPEGSRIRPGVHEFLNCVLKERWRKYRKALKQCRKNYGEESVHQLRIETRRTLALLDVLRPFHPFGLDRIETRFKKLFKGSASLRDTQVQLCYLEKDLEKFPAIRSFRKHLAACEKRLSKKFLKKAAAGAKPKLKESMASIRRWFRSWRLKTALDEVHAKKLLYGIESKYASVVKARGEVDAIAPATIHRLRIAFKAYRYMVELLEPFLPMITDRHLNAMRDYQGLMGEIQDLEVLLQAMEDFEKKRRKRLLEAYRAELVRRHEKLIARFLATNLPGPKLPLAMNPAARNGG